MRKLTKKASYTRLLQLFEKCTYQFCKKLETTEHQFQYIIRDRMKFSTDDIQINLILTDRANSGQYIVRPREFLKDIQDYAENFCIKEVRIIVVNPLVEKTTFIAKDKPIAERIFYEYYPNRNSNRNFEYWRGNQQIQ